MTGNEVETLIRCLIQKMGITFKDMIQFSDYVEDKDNNDLRHNRFKEYSGAGRMKEILRRDEDKDYNDYPPLKVSLRDVFSFWWRRCIDTDAFIDEVLDDIYDYFTERMRPPETKTETMDMSLDFEDALQSQITDLNEERIKRKGYG